MDIVHVSIPLVLRADTRRCIISHSQFWWYCRSCRPKMYNRYWWFEWHCANSSSLQQSTAATMSGDGQSSSSQSTASVKAFPSVYKDWPLPLLEKRLIICVETPSFCVVHSAYGAVHNLLCYCVRPRGMLHEAQTFCCRGSEREKSIKTCRGKKPPRKLPVYVFNSMARRFCTVSPGFAVKPFALTPSVKG